MRGAVHTHIGGLRRKRDRHQKRIGVNMVKLALGLGIGGVKPAKDLADLVIIKLRNHTGLLPQAPGPRNGRDPTFVPDRHR